MSIAACNGPHARQAVFRSSLFGALQTRAVFNSVPKPAGTPPTAQAACREFAHLNRSGIHAPASTVRKVAGKVVNTLLDELHVTDEFDRLVGPISRVPASQFPRLVAIALLLRHSWSLDDLSRTGKRVGLWVGPLEAELNTFGCDCSRRRRRSSRAPLSGPRPH